jgi:hypothetical protein
MAKLRRAINNSETTVPLFDIIDRADIPESGVVQIDNEKIRYRNTTHKDLLECTRGFEGTTAASHTNESTVTVTFTDRTVSRLNNSIEAVETYTETGSHQTLAADLNVGSEAGSDDGSDPKYIAAMMGNTFGNELSNDANYLGGLIGAYSITGTKTTTYPAGAVLGQITDGVTEADGAFVAYIDGDSAQTNARAAYTVMHNNSVPNSGFDVGLDLKGAAHDGYNPVTYSVAEIRLSNGTKITVSGDDIIFTNEAGDKSATITMVP